MPTLPSEGEGFLTCRYCDEKETYLDSDGNKDQYLVRHWTAFIPRYSCMQFMEIQDVLDFTFQGQRYCCPNCDPDTDLFVCAWCEGWVDDEHQAGVYVPSDDCTICLDCYEDNAFSCNDCGDCYHIDNGNTVNEDYTVCEGCLQEYTYCESCQTYNSADNMRSGEDAHDLLEELDRFEEADNFDEIDEYICTYCADDRGWPSIIRPSNPYIRRMTGIHNYTFVPEQYMIHTVMGKEELYRFAGTRKDRRTRVFGWELEIESGSAEENIQARAYEINQLAGGNLFYCKSDASITNGFEIVSHPGTFEFWSGPGKEILEPLFETLKSSGYTSFASGRCGLHIHTNRAAITRLHTYNLARFMHDRTCTPKLKKLSGRIGTDNLECYARLSLGDTFDRDTGSYGTPSPVAYAKQVLLSPLLGDRSRAINLARRDTVELRLFRGTLKLDKFMGSLQFYRTVLEYTNPTNGHLKVTEKTRWLNYRNFVEDYPQPKAVRELKVILQEAEI